MCGRSSLHDAPRNILERFSLPPIPDFNPRYNICPTQEQLTLAVDGDGKPALSSRRWGLIPEWAEDMSIGNRLINARAESLASRHAFMSPLRFRRCVVIADGYFEWMREGKKKTPFFFHYDDDHSFAMAGLWDRWNVVSPAIESCTVITVPASNRTAQYHDRMPAMLSLDAAEEWIHPRTGLTRALELLSPCEDDDFVCHEVSTTVNSPANDSYACIAPAPREKRPVDDGPLLLDL
jgi:putative SOS response-associated peptidase YedK